MPIYFRDYNGIYRCQLSEAELWTKFFLDLEVKRSVQSELQWEKGRYILRKELEADLGLQQGTSAKWPAGKGPIPVETETKQRILYRPADVEAFVRTPDGASYWDAWNRNKHKYLA